MSDILRTLLDEEQLEEAEKRERRIERNTFVILNACPIQVRDLTVLQSALVEDTDES